MAGWNGSEYLEYLDVQNDNFGRRSNADQSEEENELMWAALEKLPSHKRTNFALLENLIESLDNFSSTMYLLLHSKIISNFSTPSNSALIAEMGLEIPKVEVRYENITITANVKVGSRALPTLLNFAHDVIEDIQTKETFPYNFEQYNVTGIVKPGRMTLLLGPPGSGKSTLLLALSGKLDNGLKRTVK
ncbi:hypothetical protein P3S67_024330 [Capsicum chacoense]